MSSILYKYVVAVPVGALSADAMALRETAEALRIAEQVGDDHTMALARLSRGVVLVHHGGRAIRVLAILTQAREIALKKGFTLNAMAVVDPEIAREKSLTGDLDGAIELSRAAIDDMFDQGAMFLRGCCDDGAGGSVAARGAVATSGRGGGRHRPVAGYPSNPASFCTKSRYFGCAHYSPTPTEMASPPDYRDRSARWRHHWASRGI